MACPECIPELISVKASTWRVAQSLLVLRGEINAWAPSRSKLSDGTIGDAAHASRCSRHNPNDLGIVCALDVTHDPNNGCDIHALARNLVRSPRHPELEYIVSNHQICSRNSGWVWRAYFGSNPHTLHAHFAVGRGSDCEPTPPYDSTEPWNVTLRMGGAPITPGPVNLGDDMPVYVRTAANPNRVLERLPGGAYVDLDDDDIYATLGVDPNSIPIKPVKPHMIVTRQSQNLPALG